MKETSLSFKEIQSEIIKQRCETIEDAKLALANSDDETERLKAQAAMAQAQKDLADIYSRISLTADPISE